VIPIVETKERRHDTVAPPWRKHGPAPAADYVVTGKRVLFLPGMHTLRRTMTSVADGLKIPSYIQMLLTNHSFSSRDVHEQYIRHEWAHLLEIVEQIDARLWELMGGRQPRPVVLLKPRDRRGPPP
jgi:hypothetical protein